MKDPVGIPLAPHGEKVQEVQQAWHDWSEAAMEKDSSDSDEHSSVHEDRAIYRSTLYFVTARTTMFTTIVRQSLRPSLN